MDKQLEPDKFILSSIIHSRGSSGTGRVWREVDKILIFSGVEARHLINLVKFEF